MNPPDLDPRHVHVWRVSVSAWSDSDPDPAPPEDQIEIDRLAREPDRKRAAAARGVFRDLASRYLSCRPRDLRLIRSDRGKPRLADPAGLRFNWAHSGDLILLGFTRDREIGVDVEELRSGVDLHAIAMREFTPRERAQWKAAGDPDRAFFRIWVRKEAIAKATGQGLMGGIARVETGGPTASHEDGWLASAGCRVRDVPVRDPAVGAVALDGSALPEDTRVFDWPRREDGRW